MFVSLSDARKSGIDLASQFWMGPMKTVRVKMPGEIMIRALNFLGGRLPPHIQHFIMIRRALQASKECFQFLFGVLFSAGGHTFGSFALDGQSRTRTVFSSR